MTKISNATLGLAICFLAAAPTVAAAAQRADCSSTILGRKVEVVSVQTSGGFDVTLTADGTVIPALGGKCFYSDRPSTRYVLCAYELGKTRVDVYPWVQTVSGSIKTMQYIVWANNSPGAATKFNCSK